MGQFWIRSGIAGLADDAAEHFFLPERYTDPFENMTTLNYDPRDLFITSSTDPVGNTVLVEKFDYRVLAPREIQDINGNHSEVIFDVLGLPAAVAVKGKKEVGRWQGDHLDDFTDALLHPEHADVVAFCTNTTQDNEQARQWLGNATTRFVYHFGETVDASDQIRWGTRMAGVCTITRERHSGQLAVGETSLLQVALECSDGGGNVLMQKIQAEPDSSHGPNRGQPRWIVNGLTVLNNKGKPVKQYEPAFTDRFGCERPQANGVTPVMYYDAPGRLIRTELPDGTLSRVEFSPWHVTTFDPNDTVRESQWYGLQDPPDPIQPLPTDPITGKIIVSSQQRAAWLAAQHANTPAQVFLDSLGRDVISVEDNKDEKKYVTFTKLDAEGKPLWIRDDRGNLVMQYITPQKPTRWEEQPHEDIPTTPTNSVPCYDIAGNLLFQHSMDGGDRWIINDAAGQPFYAWDFNKRITQAGDEIEENRIYQTRYDVLRRPLEQQLRINDDPAQVIERFVYGDTPDIFPVRPVDQIPEAQERNLRGQVFQHYDSSGLMTIQILDFKGNLLEVSRQLVRAFDAPVIHWPENPPEEAFEVETFTQITEYDALDRMTRLYNWHQGEGSQVAVYEPMYNERGVLKSEDMVVGATKTAAGYEELRPPQAGGIPRVAAQRTTAIVKINYDAKGQRTQIQYGNATTTSYEYDDETFRLIHLRTTPTPGNTLLQDLYYTYDPVGNITEIRDDAQQTVFFDTSRVEPDCKYEYDALYRLVRAEGREHAVQNNSQRDNSPFESRVIVKSGV